MCRLYAIISDSFIDGNFIDSALNYLSPLSKKHKDGWGVGYYNFGRPMIYKSDKSLYMDTFPESLRKDLKNSKIIFFHIRRASPGIAINMDNVHPFKLGNYIFAHNGTINNYKDRILPQLSRKVQQSLSDHTDSEAMFYYLYDKLIQGYSYKESFEKLLGILDNDFTALNTMLSDGLSFYVTNLWNIKPNYHSLYYRIIEEEETRTMMIRSTADSKNDEDIAPIGPEWIKIGNHKMMIVSPNLEIRMEDI